MTGTSMRVLVAGDPYFRAGDFETAIHRLADRVDVTFAQIDTSYPAAPRTPSHQRLREYAGDPAEVAELVAGYDVLVVHGAPVGEETLSQPGLRLVCCARGGPVNVDLEAANRYGVPVCNTPGKNAEAVAQLTVAFALMLIRGVIASSRHLATNSTKQSSVFDGREFFGRESTSLRLGLVGLGLVGRQVARHAGDLGFKVLGHDPYRRPGSVPGVEMVGFDELFACSDLVSVHARSTPENLRMVGVAQLAAMPRGSYLINTAREQLVDEAALLSALRSGHLAGAALDVIELHSGERRNPLLDEPNVIVTPHIGGATMETLARGADMAVAAITAMLDGDELPYVVNPEALRKRATSGADG